MATGSSRARIVRAFASQMQDRYGLPFEADYDTGPKWRLTWSDGPTYDTVRPLVAAGDLAGAQLGLYRTRSTAAIVLTAVRMAAAGQLGRFAGGGYRSGPLSLVESQVDDTDFPDRPADDLQAALAARLLAIATTTAQAAGAEYNARPRQGFKFDDVPQDVEATAATLIRDRGLGWLIEEAAQAGTLLPPLLVLSARYAPLAAVEQATAWRERAQPLPISAAVAAAVADEQLSRPAAAALLAVLPQLRAEFDQAEAAAITAARRAGVTSAPTPDGQTNPAARGPAADPGSDTNTATTTSVQADAGGPR